jgi:peptide/nickel transport system permease protein
MLLLLSMVVFLGVRATGDPALQLLGQTYTEEDYQRTRHLLGLDQPIWVQYEVFIRNAMHGDFGSAVTSGQPVRNLLLQRLPNTLQLAFSAFALVTIVGIALGVLSAVKRGTLLDSVIKVFAVLGVAAPNFWIAIMLIMLFGGILRLLPTNGSGGLDHLILPAFVLGWPGLAGMARVVRASMLEVLDSEYVKFARLKGLPEWLVVYKHALKNAMIPALTFGGLSLAGLLNGSVVVEVVFGWPGIGRLMLQGIAERDVGIVQATVLTAGLFYVVMSLVVDILYGYVDPRITYK